MLRALATIIFLILPAAAALADGGGLKAMQLISLERRALDDAATTHLGRLLMGPGAPRMPRYDAAWLATQPKATGDSQWECLAEALYFEARGESIRGQFAVAEVILNRVESGRFPDSICDVVRQGTGRKFACQFTYTCDGLPEHVSEKRAWERVAKVARAVLDGRNAQLTEGATHYHTTAVNPDWANVYERTAQIGAHLFYRHTWRSTSR